VTLTPEGPVAPRAPPIASARGVFGSRPVIAALLALALSAIPELVPALEPLRVWTPPPARDADASAETSLRPEVGEAELASETEGRSTLAPAVEPGAARGPIAQAPPETYTILRDKEPKVRLADASGGALRGFFEALGRTHRLEPHAITRILHYGDSIVASDFVSSTLRRKFQERFGDAGHGFALIANAWPAYFHNDIERYATAGWKVSRITGPYAADGLYGLGCVSFRAERNALARFTTAKTDFGGRASRFLISYLEEPGGGAFEVSVDGAVQALVETHGDVKRARLHRVEVADGPHSFQILTKRGTTRLFGVMLERDTPGVVLDAIGIQGARIRFLDKQDDAHFAAQLAERAPNLIVYQFGANESADGFLYSMEDYHRTMKAVLEQAQRAVPNASCLVIGAMDRAAKRGDELVSIRVLPHLIAEQRKVASEVGCAFFDTFTAMGGAGSMATWVKRGLGQADLTHPTGVGAELIGTWIFRALLQSYGEFVAAPSTPGPAAAPSASTSSSTMRAPSVR
jgi:lysophospholipase L1-like esterase